MADASWVSLVEHLVWPVAVIVLVLVLRRQIGKFLVAVGGRITHVSVMSVTVELAAATETRPPWQGLSERDARGLVPAQDISDSYFDTLRQALLAPGHADFFVVDLKSDGRHEWLSSRLYLFTYVLSRMKGVRVVVFTATRGDVARSFLGVAEPDCLMRALATTEPWLRRARLYTEAMQVGYLPQPTADGAANVAAPSEDTQPPVPGDIEEWWQETRANLLNPDPLNVPRQFLECIQSIQPVGAASPGPGWLELPSTADPNKTWEHASWITATDLIDGVLSHAVQPGQYVTDDRSWLPQQRVRAVAQSQGNFVALLGPNRRFERLIDRPALLEAAGAVTIDST